MRHALRWRQLPNRVSTCTFPYVPGHLVDVLEDVSAVPGVQDIRVARRTPDGFHDVTLTLPESAFRVPVVHQLLEALGMPLPSEAVFSPPAVATRRVLRSYQQTAVDFLVQHGGGILGDEMGLGKTTSAIAAAAQLAQGGVVCIVAPRFTCAVWQRELQAVLGETSVFVCTGRKPTPEQEVAMGKAKWWFIHYEILDGWRAVLTRPLYADRPTTFIFDEAHWLRNPTATRTKAAHAVGLIARHRIVLTGTAIANHVRDLWSLLTLACGSYSFGTPFHFVDRYTIHEKGAYGWHSRGTRRVDELQARLSACYLRRTATDPEVGAELPPLTREVCRVAPTDRLPAALRKWCGGDRTLALGRLRDAFYSGNLGTDTLAVLTLWQQYTSAEKLPHTRDMVASLLEEGESVVVFVWQRDTAELLAAQVGDAALVVHGEIPQEERDARVEAFQASETPRCLIATIASLKEGVTLHAARRLILHDLDWVPAVVLQVEKRIHRIGQVRPCLVTWMVLDESADEVVAEHLHAKADVIADALRDTQAQEAMTVVRRRDTQIERFAEEFLNADGFGKE